MNKIWSDMTDEEKGALLLAYHEGKVIENKGAYNDWMGAEPRWEDNYAYRVQPEPKVEVVTMCVICNSNGWQGYHKATGYTHKITFNTIDGKPDCNSVKMKEIK